MAPSSLVVQVFSVLPRRTRAALSGKLGALPSLLPTSSDFAGWVDAHVEETRAAARRCEFVDVELGVRVAKAYRALLGQWEGLGPEGRALLAGGVAYFADPHDADDDYSSPLGFEDDAQVVSAIARALGFPELSVDPG